MHYYRQGESWLESGFAEKDAKALVDNNNASMQCAFAAKKASCILGCDCQTVAIFSSCEAACGVLCSVLGIPLQVGTNPAKVSTMVTRGWST